MYDFFYVLLFLLPMYEQLVMKTSQTSWVSYERLYTSSILYNSII